MDDSILMTELNDFIFCPMSIYFHKLYGSMERVLYQDTPQMEGTAAHENVDKGTYSTKNSIITSLNVYCEKYRLVGKIDIYDAERKVLRERKKRIKVIYDGYYFQVYAQCLAMREMGYPVQRIELYSLDDNKTYQIPLPEDNEEMMHKFEKTIDDMRNFDMGSFIQLNGDKCKNCIYSPACDRAR